MVGRAAKPTKAQKERMDLVSQLPCHDCEYDELQQPFPTEVDHSVRNGYRKHSGGHSGTMPRCSWHHRGVCRDGMNAERMRFLYGPSKALHHKQHIERYGNDEEVLERTNAKLARIVRSTV